MGNHSDGHFQNLPVACSFSHGRSLKAKISDILPKNHLVAAVSTVGGSLMGISKISRRRSQKAKKSDILSKNQLVAVVSILEGCL